MLITPTTIEMRYCEMYASDEVPRGRCVYRKWSVINVGQQYISYGSRYHEKDGTMLSEKHCQPIFFGRPSQRHDITSVIVDCGIRPSESRKRLLAIFNVVEFVVKCLVSLFRRSSERQYRGFKNDGFSCKLLSASLSVSPSKLPTTDYIP